MIDSRSLVIALTFGFVALAGLLPAEDKPEGKKPDAPAPAPAPDPQGPKIIIRQRKGKPPEKVALPSKAGDYPAADVLSLAGVLTGRTVRLDSDRVRETKVSIDENTAGDEVNLDELKLILASHRLFLFPITDPKEGEVLVVSRNPEWKEEPPRFTKVIEVSEQSFKAAWEKIEKAVKERNAKLPPGEAPIVALPDERTGKIILGAGKEEHLTDLKKELEKEIATKDPDRPHLYTYTGLKRSVTELEKGLREKLSEADLNQTRIVLASRGNRIYFRAPTEVWDKVQAALKELDK